MGVVLSSRERLILIFEEANPAAGGHKEERIRQTFGFSATRYQQLLLGMLDRQDAEEEFPQLVHRLRRLTLERQALRRGRAA
ncbi:DUF3263 domain-containing protein [Leifsonia virtsii]|uniref:DUF3263 domain-containing protein n=1 Tax=Leifsonia virtsii TaxID=3035915 RepID=A0ABT8J053_9MICO|nr:DUF3263 domain-containing protein [Leifsonia virtsii]MDN4598440.1 DUF3263 domain-containing protein [Leifsonia virtsii]